MNKVYKFLLTQPLQFYKVGQFIAQPGWKHKDIIFDEGDYEIIIVVEGDIYIQVGSEQITLNKNDCLLIPPHVRHFGFKESTNGSIYYWMHFFPNGEVTSSYASTLDTNHYEVKIPFLFNIINFERIAILVRELLDSANEEQPVLLASNYYMSSILIEISNQYCKSVTNHSKNSMRFEMIKNWIRIHSHEKINVKKIAKEFHMTPVYLTKLFQENEQMTTVHFINLVKAKQAEELLLTTDLSIKEIAYELSFNNEKYFLRVFKQITFITPTHYRNSYAKTYLNNVEVDPTIPIPDNS
ncbi:AraC-like transcriptional regulator YisR [Paucilactobacillus oligofermentans DSM 15707 = LMG 22743]|nr:AraC family transcriptional regulator [Paucilactobacillus oligofermentans]CUS25567.1 AraC-like transcriptional regulator YisR [Paucilactobacillus oligofermentans DSM 15707 = LMG 22743]